MTGVRVAVAVIMLVGMASTVADAQIPFTQVVIDPFPPNGPDTKTVGDIDGDGFPDIVVASSTGAGLWWYRYPAWTKHPIRTTGAWTTDMQAGDVDGDGDLDIIVPDGSGLRWYRNPRPFGDPVTTPWDDFLIGADGANNHDVEVGDLNGDGKLDVVSRTHGGANGTFAWIQPTPPTLPWTRVVVGTDFGEGTALGDIDGDGDLDIAQNGFWLENPGNVFAAPWPRHTIDSFWFSRFVGALVADINGDGRNDVVIAPSESENEPFSWYEATDPKNGPWIEHVIAPSVSYFHTFKAADVDRNGTLDLVTAEMHQSSDPDEVSVYRNLGGGLAWSQQVIGTTGSHNLRIADIDSDGDVDVVGVNWLEIAADGAAVTLWRNGLADGPPPPPVFLGGVYVALANVDGSGGAEIVTAPDAGGGPHVRLFTREGAAIGSGFMAFHPAFTGGVRIAGCDVDGDHRDDIVTAPGPGGGPHTRVWTLTGGLPSPREVVGWMAYDPAFTGGVHVACGDVDGDPDGRAEIVTAADAGGGPHVRIWKVVGTGAALSVEEVGGGFYAYAPAFTGGVRVATADVDGDGRAEIVTAAGPGGGPHVRVWRLAPFEELAGFFAYAAGFTGGVYVAGADLHPAPGVEIVTGPGAGGGPHVRVFSVTAGGDVTNFFAFAPAFGGGVRVAAGTLAGGPGPEIVVGPGPGGGPHVRGFSAGGDATETSFMAY